MSIETVVAKKITRTHAFLRDFNGSAFDGPITLTPGKDLVEAGVSPITYNAAELPGFATLPKSARVVLLRGIADQLTTTFGNVVKGDASITEAIDEMNDVFTSIIEDTFTFGRAGGTGSALQGVALTAALLTALQAGLQDRASAMAHPNYPLIKQRLQNMMAQAESYQDQANNMPLLTAPAEGAPADVIAKYEADYAAKEKLEMDAAALRSAYMRIAKEESVANLRKKWYPPKAKTEDKPVTTLADIFAGLPTK